MPTYDCVSIYLYLSTQLYIYVYTYLPIHKHFDKVAFIFWELTT